MLKISITYTSMVEQQRYQSVIQITTRIIHNPIQSLSVYRKVKNLYYLSACDDQTEQLNKI